jgi:hypothetical protein
MLLASSLPALASTAPETAPAFRPVMLERSGSVLVKSLPAHSAAASHRTRPFLRLTAGGAAGPQANAIGVTTLPASPLATGAVENVVTAFPAISLDRQLALATDQFVTPPDTQVAAGPNHLVEMVNSSGSVWDKSGTLLNLFDLNAFFAVPPGYSFSDPRILYDSGSQRWFASGVAFVPSTLASVVTIDVSTTSNPLDKWVQYSAANSSNLTHDQPKIGVSSDKVVLSWNDFLFGRSFQGQSTWVLEKSQMVAGIPANGVAIGPDSTRQSLVPAIQLTSNSAEYIVYNRGASVGVVTITGTPLLGNVAWNESDPAAPPTSAPPTADQPGMPGSIATNDDRFLTAVWENGILWTGGNDGCVPGGDTVRRPCSRLIQVFTSTATINQDFDIATTGGGLYYPAFALDGNGNMYVVYNISDSSTQYVGVRITGQLAGAAPQTVAAAQTIRSGDATYNMNPCFGTTGASRWGDYAGAAIDPQNPTDVWVASEYAAIGTTGTPTKPSTAGCAWGTFAAQLTFAVTVVPDFTLSAAPSSHTVTQGASTTYNVTVNSSNGFNGTVDFSLSGQPADVSGTFSPTSVTISGPSILTVTTSSTTPPGSYPLTITGTSGTLIHTAVVTLVVNAPTPPDFTLSANPGSQTVLAGAGTTYTVTITPTGGFSGSVALTVSGLPAGATGIFGPVIANQSTLTVSTSSTTSTGSFALTITGTSTGTSGTLSHSAAVTLLVQDFSLSATPASQTVKHGTGTSYAVSITRTGGFTGAATLSAGGLPTGVSVGFNPNGTTGTSSTMSVSTSSRTSRGTYVLSITGVSGSLSHSTTVTLVVR